MKESIPNNQENLTQNQTFRYICGLVEKTPTEMLRILEEKDTDNQILNLITNLMSEYEKNDPNSQPVKNKGGMAIAEAIKMRKETENQFVAVLESILQKE
ncbi:MAG: hypothetical protein H6779_03080 [Candidatus Nomurabacteria bacterium]|nr:MAG: hypothetical protein H6779_03080 [Candidatus Nomurabacteria bacterium]